MGGTRGAVGPRATLHSSTVARRALRDVQLRRHEREPAKRRQFSALVSATSLLVAPRATRAPSFKDTRVLDGLLVLRDAQRSPSSRATLLPVSRDAQIAPVLHASAEAASCDTGISCVRSRARAATMRETPPGMEGKVGGACRMASGVVEDDAILRRPGAKPTFNDSS